MPVAATLSHFPPPLPFSSILLPARSSVPPKVKPLHSKQNNSPTRRDLVLLSFLLAHTSVLSAPAASAIDIGISGPKEWLKEQKKKSSKFLLAPVDASRQTLRSAYLLLTETEDAYTDEDLQEFQQLFRSAVRDCVPQERNSFVTFQANTGVEHDTSSAKKLSDGDRIRLHCLFHAQVCTFRLIVKNAASLLGNKDPVKLKAEALLDNLIRSFTSVSGLARETNIQLSSDRKKIADAVSDTLSSLDKFEQGIRDCLEI